MISFVPKPHQTLTIALSDHKTDFLLFLWSTDKWYRPADMGVRSNNTSMCRSRGHGQTTCLVVLLWGTCWYFPCFQPPQQGCGFGLLEDSVAFTFRFTFQSSAAFWHVKTSHFDVVLQLYFLTSTRRNTPTQTQTLHWQILFSQLRYGDSVLLCVMSVSYCSFHLFVVWNHMTHMTNKKYSKLLQILSHCLCLPVKWWCCSSTDI